MTGPNQSVPKYIDHLKHVFVVLDPNRRRRLEIWRQDPMRPEGSGLYMAFNTSTTTETESTYVKAG